LISEAFNSQNMPEYLRRVRSLPSGNPLSSTNSISFETADDAPISRSTGSGGLMRAGVAAAAAGVVVLAAGLAVMRSRTRDIEDDGEESFSPHKETSSTDSATVAGETCGMSMDGSSVAQSWKSPVGFRNETDDDDEFEDEPLDSDDDSTDLTTRKTNMISRMSST